jgi:hypothetical protein
MTFTTDCIHAQGPDIHQMVEKAREISWRTFMKHVAKPNARSIIEGLGYTTGPGNKQGLRIQKDYHVRYFKSTYKTKPCVYLKWSAIELIFT